MKNIKYILMTVVAALFVTSCDWFVLDNQEAHNAKISGKFVDAETGQLVPSEVYSSQTGVFKVVELGWDSEATQTWYIKNDGVEYTTEAYRHSFNGYDAIFLGNEGYMKGESTNLVEPFFIYRLFVNNHCFLATFDISASHTVAIYKVGGNSNDLSAGLYQTGAIALYEEQGTSAIEGMMIKSWDELLADGIVHVEDGVVYTDFDSNEFVNASSEALAGDLILPNDGSITKIGDAHWDPDVWNEQWGEYGYVVGNYAFNNCKNLTGIKIPDSATLISYFAFYECDRLTTVNTGDGVSIIDEAAFSDCTNLKGVMLGNNVKSIGRQAFSCCTGLTSIDTPDSVVSIGAEAFYGCVHLKDVTICSGVEYIAQNAFGYITDLTTLTFKNGENWTVYSMNSGEAICNIDLSDPYLNAKLYLEKYNDYEFMKITDFPSVYSHFELGDSADNAPVFYGKYISGFGVSPEGIKSVIVNGVAANIYDSSWGLELPCSNGDVVEIVITLTDNANNSATISGFLKFLL